MGITVSLIYAFFGCDKDVVPFIGVCKAARQSVDVMRGTAGAIYFGGERIDGLWRFQSPKMVARSCCMWSKIEFLDDCKAVTPAGVELCVSAVAQASFYANTQAKYFFVRFRKAREGYFSSWYRRWDSAFPCGLTPQACS